MVDRNTAAERGATGEDPGPQVLREYAFLGDGERGAVIGPEGEIAWLCFPGWDDPPLFASLLGGRSRYVIRPAGRFVWGGQYDEGSLMWRSRWVQGNAIIECLDVLAYPGDHAKAVLVRRLTVEGGPAQVHVEMDLTDDFHSRQARRLHRSEDGTWAVHVAGVALRWSVPDELTWTDGPGHGVLPLASGRHADLVLELASGDLPAVPADADTVLSEARVAWGRAIPALDHSIAPRDARHSVAVLIGMTTATGAMVAASTTSLPERAEEGRNYDYRYAWIRDQCYTGIAGAKAGPGGEPLLDAAVRFVHERLLEDGPELRPAYRTSGESVPAEVVIDIPGYPGAPTVKTGNHAGRQFQLDAFGEALTLIAAAAAADRLHGDGWRAAEIAADAIEARWTEPDAGIWELSPDHWTHSRLACIGGLRRISAVAGPGPRSNRWMDLADVMLAEIGANSMHPTGRFQRSPGDPRCDASLLMASLRGAVPADDVRARATLDAVRRDLTVDGYVFRYPAGDAPLGQAEGAFPLCGFWLALACHQAGLDVSAARFFERNRAGCGPAGIFSEEFDPHQRQLRGNFPQAFVHALMLEAACTLGED